MTLYLLHYPDLLAMACCALQYGLAKTLRAMVVYLLSAAAFTINLPPISTAFLLWQGVSKQVR
jgi:hypothetical protein